MAYTFTAPTRAPPSTAEPHASPSLAQRLGLVAGWLLTMNYDRPRETRPELPPLSFLPLPGVVPVESTMGTAELLPGLMSQGRF